MYIHPLGGHWGRVSSAQNLEEINVLRITLDTQIEDLEQHFETAHINYLQVPFYHDPGCEDAKRLDDES